MTFVSYPLYRNRLNNRQVAESTVSVTLEANQLAIQSFVKGSSPTLVLGHSFSSPVGVVVTRGCPNAVPASSIRVVLLKDTSLPTGYRIQTGYPKP